MNIIQEYVADLTEDQRYQIIKDWEQFEKDGYIGNCFLRESVRKIIPSGSISITLIMKDIAFEVFRYYTNEYLK